MPNRVGQSFGFVQVWWLGATMGNITEGAASSADISQDHKRRRAATETLREVWATGFLAHSVKSLVA
jgi:hypothetical protein